MNPSLPEDPELIELVQAYCNGLLEKDRQALLEQKLLEDPQARAFYLRYMNLDAALREQGPSWSTIDQPVSASPPGNNAHRRPRWRTQLVPACLGLGAAAAAIALIVVLLRDNPSSVDPVRRQASNPVPAEVLDNGVAVLTQALNAVWADKDPPRTGAALPSRRLRIASGIVQFEFYSGARVVLEGPADFELVSMHKAICRQGKVRALVPPQARGFIIVAPQVELIDLGTEFGMEVDKEGQTDVHVFTGQVEYQKPAAAPGQPARLLNAGSALHFDPSGAATPIPASADTFVSNEEVERRAATDAENRYRRWQAASAERLRDERLLLHFGFEEELRGRTLHGTPVGPGQDGAIVGCSWATGRWPKKGALEFKTPADRVRFRLDAACDSLTLMAWLRVDGLDHRFNSLMLTDDWRIGEPHWQIGGRGEIILGLHGAGRAQTNYTSKPIFGPATFGQWTHLTTVYDHRGHTVTHYVNGKSVSKDALRFDVPLHIGNAELGNWMAGKHSYPVRNLNGRIDEFSLFAAALTADEIAMSYQTGKPR
jgi:hypothetical protein